MTDAEFLTRFENIRTLVRNLRNVLPPLTHAQSELVGLYILNAVYLGEGEPFTTFPTLGERRPQLRLVVDADAP